MKQVYLREKRNNEFNENAIDFVFGAPVMPASFENAEIDEYSLFFMQIQLDEKNINGLPSTGNLYIFFDMSKYYKGELGEGCIQPKLYYSKGELELILDDYNDAFLDTLPEVKTQYEVQSCFKKEGKLMLGGTPLTVDEEKWNESNRTAIVSIPSRSAIIPFFEHFANDCKEIIVSIDNNLKFEEDTWLDAYFNIVRK